VGHRVLCCLRDSHLRAGATSTMRACLSPRASTNRRQVPVVKWRLTLLGRSLRCFTMYTACSHHPSTLRLHGWVSILIAWMKCSQEA